MLAHRHHRQDRQLLSSQIQRGRPYETWRLCGNAACTNELCIFWDLHVTLLDNEKNEYGIQTSTTYDAYITAATRRFSGHEESVSHRLTKYREIESFLHFPPVRGAYCTFKMDCVELGITLQPNHAATLRDTIRGAISRFDKIIKSELHKTPSPTIHRYLGMADYDPRLGNWNLEDIVLRYLITLELWRHSEVGKSRGWSFGAKNAVHELLSSSLLQFWQMDVDGFFVHDDELNAQRWNVIWEEWLETFPPIEDDESKVVTDKRLQMGSDQGFIEWGVGCLTGFGRRSLGWMGRL